MLDLLVLMLYYIEKVVLLDSDLGFFIRFNRVLFLFVKYYSVVFIKIINVKVKGCFYIFF